MDVGQRDAGHRKGAFKVKFQVGQLVVYAPRNPRECDRPTRQHVGLITKIRPDSKVQRASAGKVLWLNHDVSMLSHWIMLDDLEPMTEE